MTAYKNLQIKSGLPIKKILEVDSIILSKKLSLDNFKALAVSFPDLRMERDKDGKTTIMSPVNFGTGKREVRVSVYLGSWWIANDEIGEFFSPSTAIELNDTSVKCPDAGWISEERLALIPVEEEDDNFLKVAPDFIVEVKSKSDSLKKLKKKMSNSWIKNGVRLAWLIDPYKQKAYIYRENQELPEEVVGFEDKFLDGEEIVKGFKLSLEKFRIFNRKKS